MTMSETTTRLFRHSAWASQRMYEAVTQLPLEALDAYVSDPQWSVGRILQHIVGGADWYVYCLTQAPLGDQKKPADMDDVRSLAAELAGYDEAIASQASLPDEYVTITEGEKSWQNLRSTILAQLAEGFPKPQSGLSRRDLVNRQEGVLAMASKLPNAEFTLALVLMMRI